MDVRSFIELDRHAVSRLAWKYETLLTLRRERNDGKPIPARTFFRALCAEFPGALKELDRMPPSLLERRHQELMAALGEHRGTATRVAVPLWAGVAAAYHRSLGGSLSSVPDELRERRAPGRRVARAIEHVAHTLELDKDLVQRLLFPWSTYGALQLVDSGTIAGAPASSTIPVTSQHIDASPSSLNREPASTHVAVPVAASHWPVD